MKRFKSNPKIVKLIENLSESLFVNREEAHEYLEREVYSNQEFINHIEETAITHKVSYIVAYTVVTDYLTDIMYELDLNVAKRKTKKRILIHSYFFLSVGFMESFKDKKLFIESYLKKLQL